MIPRGGVVRESQHTIIKRVIPHMETMPVNSCPVLQHVIGDMDDKVITPIGKDRGTRNSAVKGHACSKVAVRGAVSLLDREPVLPGVSGVGPGGVVIGIETKLSPAFTGSRSVFTTLTRLQRCEMRV